MAKFTNNTTGMVVSVADEKASRFGSGWTREGDAPATPDDEVTGAGGYADTKVDDLKAEIERRNEGRGDADRLSTTGVKADLIAALQADDDANK